MHTEIIIFHDNDNGCSESAYDTVNRHVQDWLREHPQAVYTNSHSTSIKGNYGEGHWTEFSLTLVVNVPDVAPAQPENPTQSLDDLQLDHMGDDSFVWQQIRATVKTYPQIHIQDRQVFGGTGWNVTVSGLQFGRTAGSTEELLNMVKGLQQQLQLVAQLD